jgi:hypothetical protein
MSKNTVTFSELGKFGRLGNQLFQIACTIGYALDHDKDFIFPPWHYNQYLKHSLPTTTDIISAHWYEEPYFYYKEIPQIDGNVDLHGYFQSIKYWEKYRDEIRYWLEPNDKLKIRVVTNTVLLSNACAVHVRRGDYVTTHYHFYHILTPEYYYKAAKEIYGNDIKDVTFVMCSDDMEWAMDNIDFPNMYVPNEDDITELFIMAHCDNHIIANSSFSWWSSFLSNKPNKKVIAPRLWFKDPNMNTKDMYRSEMIII